MGLSFTHWGKPKFLFKKWNHENWQNSKKIISWSPKKNIKKITFRLSNIVKIFDKNRLLPQYVISLKTLKLLICPINSAIALWVPLNLSKNSLVLNHFLGNYFYWIESKHTLLKVQKWLLEYCFLLTFLVYFRFFWVNRL